MSETINLAFPQQATINIDNPNPLNETIQRQKGPNFFRDGENVHFMRAEAAKAITYNENSSSISIELETKLYIHRTAQTHDSVMHQFIDGEGKPGAAYLRLRFFTNDIFRVQFALDQRSLDSLSDEPVFPFPEARMLVGQSLRVETEFKQFIDDETSAASFSSSKVTVLVQRKPFRLSAVRKGEKTPFWKQRLSDLFISDVIPASVARHQGREATFESFQLSPGEALFGLGERFDGVARRGRVVDFVNHDAIGTSNTRSYINVPFFWSTAGYGCFLHSYARAEWDMGKSDAGSVGISMEEPFMDYFIISGTNPKNILQRYTQDLTGKPSLPPIWSYGVWFSRNSYPSWDVVDEVVERCREERVPLDVIHLDTYWFEEDWNMDLLFDTKSDRFARPEIKIPKLLEDGIRISLWQCTFLPPREDNIMFREGSKEGYLAYSKNADGSRGEELFSYPSGTTGWRTDDCVIDYSNPATREWYGSKIAALAKIGVAAIKTDFGDCHTPDAWYHSVNGRRFQNTYTLAYNATISKAMKSVNSDTLVWARSGTAGSQRFPVHWGGDSQCSWTALQGSFTATLSMGLSGFPFFASDCGGFIGKPDAELYTRWAQLSLLSASHFRSHGAGNENSREPWTFGDVTLSSFRKFADLRYQLLPYIVEQSRKSVEEGVGLVRHLVLEWPKDRNVWSIETQCLLGESLMVVPVMESLSEIGKTMEVYFPKGRWVDFWTKEVIIETEMGEWRQINTPDLESMNIFVRDSTVLCFAEEGRLRTFNQVGKIVKVECYGLAVGDNSEPRVHTVGDGIGSLLEVRLADGKCAVDGRADIKVRVY